MLGIVFPQNFSFFKLTVSNQKYFDITLVLITSLGTNINSVSIICRLRTADRTENKMQTEQYKMQTGDKMQTGCELGIFYSFLSAAVMSSTLNKFKPKHGGRRH